MPGMGKTRRIPHARGTWTHQNASGTTAQYKLGSMPTAARCSRGCSACRHCRRTPLATPIWFPEALPETLPVRPALPGLRCPKGPETWHAPTSVAYEVPNGQCPLMPRLRACSRRSLPSAEREQGCRSWRPVGLLAGGALSAPACRSSLWHRRRVSVEADSRRRRTDAFTSLCSRDMLEST